MVRQVRDASSTWTVTGRVWQGRWGGRGHYRLQVECICLECSSTWWSTHALAMEEHVRRYPEVPLERSHRARLASNGSIPVR